MTFVDAVYEKYATEHVDRHDALTQQAKEIEISGKTAFEVGFDKIRAQLAELDQLKIVIVDAMRISWSEPDIGWDTPVVENGKRTWHGSAKDFNSEELASYSGRRIRDMCPKIQELDLSRNLFEDVNQILRICKNLDDLRSLRIK